MEMVRKNNLLGILAALAGNVIFGVTFVFTKHILNAGMSPYALLTWRLAIATLLMLGLAACGLLKMDFRGKNIRKLLPLGLAQPCFYFVCESFGIARTTASESGTILALSPIFILILSRLFFRERQTTGQIIGVLLSVAGVVLVMASGGMSASFSLSGYTFLFSAVLITGFFNIGIRRLGGQFSSVEMTFGTTVLGLLFFSALTCAEGLITGNLSALMFAPLKEPLVLPYILLLSAGATVGAFILIIFAIGAIGPMRASTFVGFSTITSIVFGLVLLAERMLTGQLIGAAMIIAGVWCANYFVPHRSTAAEAEGA